MYNTMIKRISTIFLALTILLCMASCLGGISATPQGAFKKADLGVWVGSKVYYLREDSAPLLAELGDFYDYIESVSCVYDGMDKKFSYFDGIRVDTVPVGGKDIIEMIILTSDTYSTPRGVVVGDTMERLVDIYGKDYFDDGYITYSLTNDPEDIQSERIQFYFENGVINTIYIYSPSY